MMTLRAGVSRLSLFVLLLGAVATVPALAGSAAVGSVAGGTNASIGGQALLPNTTIFSGDSLQVKDGVAVIAVGNNNRVIFGRDTVAAFLREPTEITVSLSQGDLSMLHPSDGTPMRVKAGEISITPVAGFKTLGEVAMLDGSVVITAREGALQVEDHGATKNLAKGQTIVISPNTAKGGDGTSATSVILGGAAMSSPGSAITVATAAKAAVSAADAAASAAKFIRPGSSRPISLANAAALAAAQTNSQAACAPPTLPKRPTASEVFPLAGSAGPICPLVP